MTSAEQRRGWAVTKVCETADRGGWLLHSSGDQFDHVEVVRLPERGLSVLLTIDPVLDLEGR